MLLLLSITSSTEFVSALAGALAGAGAAFLFQTGSAVFHSRDLKHSAIIKAQLTLGLQLQGLLSFHRQSIDPYLNDPDADRNMPAKSHVFTNARLDISELSFLACCDNPNVLNRMVLAEASFLSVQEVIDKRNNASAALGSTIQIQEADIKSGKVTFIIDKNNIRHLIDIKHHTKALFEHIDLAISSLENSIRELRGLAKELLPEKSFLEIGPRPSQQTPSPPPV